MIVHDRTRLIGRLHFFPLLSGLRATRGLTSARAAKALLFSLANLMVKQPLLSA